MMPEQRKEQQSDSTKQKMSVLTRPQQQRSVRANGTTAVISLSGLETVWMDDARAQEEVPS
jgi:hypothetical protein